MRYISYLWRHLRKRTLLRNKYHRPWTDAAHDARRLFRAYDICRLWAFKGNIFLAPCAVLIKILSQNVEIADLGRHCFFHNKVPFRWWHKCQRTWSDAAHYYDICCSIRQNYRRWRQHLFQECHVLCRQNSRCFWKVRIGPDIKQYVILMPNDKMYCVLMKVILL